MGQFWVQFNTVIDESMTALINAVGDGRDINTIIVGGGAARFFRAAVEQHFPSHTVHLIPEPVFANVRGYQLAGEQLAAQQTLKELA